MVPRMDDPRKFAQARELIRDRIASGTYERGTRIHVGGIADELGVARPTITRAMRELADENLVKYWPGLGWYVVLQRPALPSPSRPPVHRVPTLFRPASCGTAYAG